MKQLYLNFLALFCSLASLHAQSPTCATSTLYCAGGSTLSFESEANGPFAESGINYNCLFTQQNPYWFTLKTNVSGNLTYEISQVNESGNITDVDYILWGPFDFDLCGAAELNPSTQLSCSYAAAGIENFTIVNAPAGKYYKLLITNFSNQPGTITVTQTNAGQPNSGGTSCNIVCPLMISGDGSYACPETILMALPEYPGASYVWTSIPPGVTGFGSSLTVTQPGVYTVTMTKEGCFPTTATAVVQGSTIELPEVQDLSACSTNPVAAFNLSVNEAAVMGTLGIEDYGFYGFFHSETDARNAANAIGSPSTYQGTDGEIIYFSVEEYVSGCTAVGSFTLHIDNGTPLISFDISDQTAIVNIIPEGNYQYSLDGGAWTSSNTFTNVDLGAHNLEIMTACGSLMVTFNILTPNPPFGSSPQYYTEGQTLGDLEMTGQNIQWYDNTSRNISSTPLPLSTLLVNNTTYYATQTINGAESTNRFPVLVLSTLANPEHVFSGLNYYPNPVKNTLIVSNAMPIGSFAVFNILGQSVVYGKSGNLQTDIDVSNLSNGTYFLRLESGGAQKTIRFIKE